LDAREGNLAVAHREDKEDNDEKERKEAQRRGRISINDEDK